MFTGILLSWSLLCVLCVFVVNVFHSPTYGINAMNRARLMAVLQARWKAAQLPLRLRLKSLPWLVHIFFSPWTSL